MNEILKYLKKIRGLKEVPEKKLKTITSKVKLEEYEAGYLILSRGEKSNFVCYLISGDIKVYIVGKNNRIKTLNVLKKGTVFGEMGLIMNRPRSANVLALTDVKLLIIPKSVFMKLISMSNSFSLFIMRYLSERLYMADKEIESLSFQNSKDRIIATLLRLSHEYGRKSKEGIEIAVQLSIEDIAELAEVNEKVVHDFFTRLVSDDLLLVKEKRIYITDEVGLSNLIISD